MTTNPYAPPTAAVADMPADDSNTPAYFPVSTTKLLVMSLCTFLLYEVYWFYKHWKLIKEREGLSIIPVLRAIFSVFFVYSLFRNIRDEADRLGVKPVANVGAAASGWVLLTLVGNFADRFAGDFGDKFVFVSFLSVFFILPVQACANRINEHVAPDHDPNSRFTAWNWLGIIVGIGYIALAIYGSMLPPE